MAPYTVQSGDSYWAIAASLGIDPIELLQLNHKIKLQPNKQLKRTHF